MTSAPRAAAARRLLAAIAGAMLAALAGCATPQQPDPLEPWNRKVFAFNEGLDKHVLKPTAEVYRDTLPAPVRKAATNFFNNVFDAWSALNLFLQGRVTDGLSDVMRFGSNTVFGVLGLVDVATPMGLERHDEDLGQTLGRWGVGPGAYIVWPLFGPSSLRDSIGLPIELRMSAETWVSPVRARNVLTVTKVVDRRANLLQATSMLDDIALDKYVFLRNGYLQRRRNLVYDGDPPPLEDETGTEDEDPGQDPAAGAAAPEASASQPAK